MVGMFYPFLIACALYVSIRQPRNNGLWSIGGKSMSFSVMGHCRFMQGFQYTWEIHSRVAHCAGKFTETSYLGSKRSD